VAKSLPIGMTVYTAENAVSQMRFSPDATGSAFRRIRATRPNLVPAILSRVSASVEGCEAAKTLDFAAG
jgi:hypothetical protein